MLTTHINSCYVPGISDCVAFVLVDPIRVEFASVDDIPVVISSTGFCVLLIPAAVRVIVVTVVGVKVEVSVPTVVDDICVVVVTGACSKTVHKRKYG